jgi:hypothetical protein
MKPAAISTKVRESVPAKGAVAPKMVSAKLRSNKYVAIFGGRIGQAVIWHHPPKADKFIFCHGFAEIKISRFWNKNSHNYSQNFTENKNHGAGSAPWSKQRT